MHISIPFEIAQDRMKIIIELKGIAASPKTVCHVCDLFIRVTIPGKIALIDLPYPIDLSYRKWTKATSVFLECRKVTSGLWSDTRCIGMTRDELHERRQAACARAEEFHRAEMAKKLKKRTEIMTACDKRLLELHEIAQKEEASNVRDAVFQAAKKMGLDDGSETRWSDDKPPEVRVPVRARNVVLKVS
jgi:hypothetical protein